METLCGGSGCRLTEYYYVGMIPYTLKERDMGLGNSPSGTRCWTVTKLAALQKNGNALATTLLLFRQCNAFASVIKYRRSSTAGSSRVAVMSREILLTMMDTLYVGCT